MVWKKLGEGDLKKLLYITSSLLICIFTTSFGLLCRNVQSSTSCKVLIIDIECQICVSWYMATLGLSFLFYLLIGSNAFQFQSVKSVPFSIW